MINSVFDELLGNNPDNNNNLDMNKLVIIILILVGKLEIESIQILKEDFTITLGTFNNNL